MSTSVNKNELRFYPVQCSDETFQGLAAQDGHVYFVTDKKKIYLGKNGEKIPMCASSGIFYGKKAIEYDDSGNMPDPEVTFLFDEVEGEDVPEIDDLILNIGTTDMSDGCFYRVHAITEEGLETTRLTLQGTGGGGSGSGGGGSGSGGSFSITITGGNNSLKVFSSAATSMPISFTGYYNGTNTNAISQVTFSTLNGETFYTYMPSEEMAFNKQHTIDLYEYCSYFANSKTTVEVRIYDLYGESKAAKVALQIVSLELTEPKVPLLDATEPSYSLSVTLNAPMDAQSISDRKLTYTFYKENNLNSVVTTVEKSLSNSDVGTIQSVLDLSKLTCGVVYQVDVQASAKINGTVSRITSNTISFKLGYRSVSEPQLLIYVPNVTEQYTDIPMHYYVAGAKEGETYTLVVKLNGVEKTSLSVQSNTAGIYYLYFEEPGTYTLGCSVNENGTSHTSYLNITEYSGNLPVIDPTRSDLMLYLTPRGKTNDAVDRDTWTDYNNSNYVGRLSNITFGATNGWLTGDNQVSYLNLTSGAQFELPAFKPFATDWSTKDGFTIEVDFEVNGTLDYNENLISCLSKTALGKIQVGLAITGEKASFYNSRKNGGTNDAGESIGALTSVNIVEGKRIRLSVVVEPYSTDNQFPMCYMYLDGKLSGASIYKESDSFADDNFEPAYFKVNSRYGQVKIYGVRFYKNALNSSLILNNYTASLPTNEARQTRYDSNNVLVNQQVNYNTVMSEDYDLQIPVMTITGGYATKDKWTVDTSTDSEAKLPTGKKDFRMIDVSVRYPKDNSLFDNYEDYSYVNEFPGGKKLSAANGLTPTNGGCIMYVQGTSSTEYPVKNLRIRWKNKENFFQVKPQFEPVEIICMKADYMDSSGSHNTGAGNLIDDTYLEKAMTPGQEHFGKDKTVTCIKGYPCLIFWSKTGDPGTYEFIGKYNLNLDKATPKPFGFDHGENDDFGYLSVGDTYYDNASNTTKTVQEGEKINAIHCYEFLDNAVEVCNFVEKKDVSSYYDTWYGTYTNSDKESVPGWSLGFESRYPELDTIEPHDADPLWPLASWVNELYHLRLTEEGQGLTTDQENITYDYQIAKFFSDNAQYYIKVSADKYELAYPTSDNFSNGEYYTRSIVSRTFKMKSLERFKNEYQCYLDKDFLLTYYLITEALLMVDSRVKNMMIATWGPKKVKYTDVNGVEQESNNYIFYPIFYDMDTMLGLDNVGAFRFTYYNQDTETNIYNGKGILWNFVRDALKTELDSYYSKLEEKKLNYNSALSYFNTNQANMANEAFYNADATYKYIDPSRYGYTDLLNNKYIEPGAAPYLYAAQGDRSLMRESYLKDRFRFIRGKHVSSGFQNGDRIEFRINWKTVKDSSGKEIAALSSNNQLDLTGLRIGYAGLQVGKNGTPNVTSVTPGETVHMIVPEFTDAANGTEAYLLGLSNLTDVGDLSNKYVQNFIIASDGDCRLTNLTIGNSHKNYDNTFFTAASSIALSNCPYLQRFNLQNCSSFSNALDFSACYNINTVLLTGSSTTSVTFPANGSLKEVRLPTTVTTININSHPNLKPEMFSIGTYDYASAGTDMIEDHKYYLNNYSNITSLNVINTNIDTYSMVRDSVALQSFYLKDVNWELSIDKNFSDSQYVSIGVDKIVDGGSYWVWDIKAQKYVVYDKNVYPDYRTVFQKIDALNGDNELVTIPVLDRLASLKSANSSSSVSESLTGTLTIKLDSSISMDELTMYNKYHVMFPDLNIVYQGGAIKAAHKIKFYRVRYIAGTTTSNNIGEPYCTILTTGEEGQTFSVLMSAEGSGYSDPTISAENTTVYTFTKKWCDITDPVFRIYDFNGSDANIVPTKSMNLVPVFGEEIRYYNVNFYDYDYNVETSTPLHTLKATYGQVLSEFFVNDENCWVNYVYRPDDDAITAETRYTLDGWISEADFNNKAPSPTKIDFSKVSVYNDINYFAHYVIESVYEPTFVGAFKRVQPSSISYSFTEITKQDTVEDEGNTLKFECSHGIQVKDAYASLLGGKITLPGEIDNEKIDTIGNMQKLTNKVTDVYFESNSNYQFTAKACFYKSPVVRVHLPETMLAINEQSFQESKVQQCSNEFGLLPDNIQYIAMNSFYQAGSLTINKLPSKLIVIGARAFGSVKVTATEIPDNVVEIGVQAFLGSSGIGVSVLPDNYGVRHCICGHSAFNSTSDVISFTIGKGWIINVTESNTLFGDNGYKQLKNISAYTDSIANVGLSSGNSTEIAPYMFKNGVREGVTYSIVSSS